MKTPPTLYHPQSCTVWCTLDTDLSRLPASSKPPPARHLYSHTLYRRISCSAAIAHHHASSYSPPSSSLKQSVPSPKTSIAAGSVTLEEEEEQKSNLHTEKESCGKGCTEEVEVDDDAEDIETIVTYDDDRGMEKEVRLKIWIMGVAARGEGPFCSMSNAPPSHTTNTTTIATRTTTPIQRRRPRLRRRPRPPRATA